MNPSLSPIFTLLFLLADIVTYAQGEASIFVCGRHYQDAEDNCGIHPSCANLQCPNTYWEEGHVLLSCFAVPIEKCNFGSPDAIPAAPVAQTPVEFDPNNMNYCGTIEGGWQLAVDNCSALTACPGGDPDECPEGQTCYGSITCDPSSKPNAKGSDVAKPDDSLVQEETLPAQTQEQGVSPESTNEVFDLNTSVEITPILAEEPELSPGASIEVFGLDSSEEIDSVPAVDQGPFTEGEHDAAEKENNFVQAETSSEQQASTEANSEVYAFDTNVEINSIASDTSDDEGPHVESPTSSTTTTTTTTTFTTTTTTTEAPEQPETSPEPNEQQHATTQLSEPVVDASVDTSVIESRNYCGPHGAEGRTRTVTTCSRATRCGVDGSCPNGMICYGDIECNGINVDTSGHQSSYEEYLHHTSNSNEDFTSSINGSPNSSSMSTAEATSTTITTPSPSETSSTPKSVEVLLSHFYCGPDPSIDHNAWMTAFEQCSPETACSDNRPCPDGQICFGGIECLAKQHPVSIVATTEINQSPTTTSIETTSISTTTEAPTTTTPTETDPTSAIDQELQMPIETRSYCGPDPVISNAWMQARANCSPATACGHGHPPCPDNMYCYGQIDCSGKDSSSYPVVLDGSAMSSDDVKDEEDDTTTSTTTTTSAATTTTTTTSATTTEKINLENNAFFCGPVSAGGYFEASELCIPCHNGDPSKCGVGMTCYAGVICSKPKSAIDKMVEEAERVHIGYCGQSFYETRDNCASRTPCSLDKDCDRWNPQCFAVKCDGIESQPSSSASNGSGISSTHTGSGVSSPNAPESPSSPAVTVTQSFCGTYEEEVADMCTTRPPCKTTKDCPGFEGCFSDISCTFSEQSDEFKQFLANVEALENPDSAELDDPTAEQPYFGLRPPSDPAYTRSSATGASYSYLVATVFPAVVAVCFL